jgi:hypothetical protein
VLSVGAEALDALRLRGERVRMGDLVIRGARERLRELEAEREDEAQRAVLGTVRSAGPYAQARGLALAGARTVKPHAAGRA